MSTETETQNEYVSGMDIVDKIHDEQSRPEWTRILNRAMMEAVARRAAERRVARLDDSVLDKLSTLVYFPPPLSMETLRLLVPEGKRVQYADLSSTLRANYGLSTYEAGDHIRRAVKAGVLYLEEEGRLKYLCRTQLNEGIDWERMTNWTRTKGPAVVVNLIGHLDCSESKAYTMIEDAVKRGILGEKKAGRSRTLWVKRKDLTVGKAVTELEPDAEDVEWDPNARCPEQDLSGVLPPPRPRFTRAFAEHWWAGREKWGNWEYQDRAEQERIWEEWKKGNDEKETNKLGVSPADATEPSKVAPVIPVEILHAEPPAERFSAMRRMMEETK